MPKQEQFEGEQPEEKKEIPQVSEKREAITDTDYASSVARYFNRRKKYWMEAESDEDFEYGRFLDEQQRSLAKVANAKQLEKLQPKDIAFALSELAGMMADNNLDYYGKPDPNLVGVDQEKEYFEAKNLFMTTCRKMFPEIEPEKNAVTTFAEVEKLSKQGIGVVSIPISEGKKLLKENPRELAEQMDTIMHIAGGSMKFQAGFGFSAEDLKDTEETEKRMGMATISYYKLQLMRDELTKQIYGRDDITHSEKKQIDEEREKVN